MCTCHLVHSVSGSSSSKKKKEESEKKSDDLLDADDYVDIDEEDFKVSGRRVTPILCAVGKGSLEVLPGLGTQFMTSSKGACKKLHSKFFYANCANTYVRSIPVNCRHYRSWN